MLFFILMQSVPSIKSPEDSDGSEPTPVQVKKEEESPRPGPSQTLEDIPKEESNAQTTDSEAMTAKQDVERFVLKVNQKGIKIDLKK